VRDSHAIVAAAARPHFIECLQHKLTLGRPVTIMAQPASWQQIRERRIAFAIASVLSPVAALVALGRIGPWGVAGAAAAWLAVLAWLRAARCPECRQPFLAGTAFPFSEQCGSCGTSHTPVTRVTPHVVLRPSVPARAEYTLTPTRRRIVGGAIAVAGAVVLVGSALWPNPTVLAAWQAWSLVGFSAISMAGGVALVRGAESGYSLARFTLWAQAVTFVLPGAAYKVRAGPFGELYVGSANLGVRLGWESSFLTWVGPTTGWEVSVNLLALVLLALLGRKPLQSDESPAP
jgi:hypothetical protein